MKTSFCLFGTITGAAACLALVAWPPDLARAEGSATVGKTRSKTKLVDPRTRALGFVAPGANLKRSVLSSGKGWTRQKLEGTVGPATFTNSADYFVVGGIEGIEDVPLRKVVHEDLALQIKASLLAEAKATAETSEQSYILSIPALEAADGIWVDRDDIVKDPMAYFRGRTICVPSPLVGLEGLLPSFDPEIIIDEIRAGVFTTKAISTTGVARTIQIPTITQSTLPANAAGASAGGMSATGSAASAGGGLLCFDPSKTGGGGSEICMGPPPFFYKECTKKLKASYTPPDSEFRESVDVAKVLASVVEGTITYAGKMSFRSPADPSKRGLGVGAKVKFGALFGIPIWFKPTSAEVYAFVDLESSVGLDVTIKVPKSWRATVEPSLFYLMIPIPIGPVVVPLWIDAPLQYGLDTKVETPILTSFTLETDVRAGFHYACKFNGKCEEKVPAYLTASTAAPAKKPSARVEGRAHAEPYVRAMMRASLLMPGVIYAAVGPRWYVHADLWGFHGACGDARADRKPDTLNGALLDIDDGLRLEAEIGIFDLPGEVASYGWGSGAPSNYRVSLNLWEKSFHLLLADLVGDGKSLQPMLGGLSPATAGKAAEGSARMRPCYPYADRVDYELDWDDGKKSSAHGAANESTAVSHTWRDPASYDVELRAVRDAHGRSLGQAATRAIVVKTQGKSTLGELPTRRR